MRDQELLIDVNILATFIGDDRAVQCRMLQMFAEQTHQIVHQINTSAMERSAADVGAYAHKLKSSARTVGALQLARLCEQLEKAGKFSEWDRVESLFPQMQAIVSAVDEHIRHLLQ